MTHYTKEYIENLLDKFMDGVTTLEEEDILVSYFRGKDVPPEWEDYLQMFQEIDSMSPQHKTSRRWIGWIVAAAVVAGILYVVIPQPQTRHSASGSLVAEADTTVILQSGKTRTELTPDTMPGHDEQMLPIQTKKRRIRKTEPTIHDIDKAYALMAEAEQERQEAERQIELAQQEIIKAQLAAYGYIPVMQEDGTIIYINEQTEFIAYEE